MKRSIAIGFALTVAGAAHAQQLTEETVVAVDYARLQQSIAALAQANKKHADEQNALIQHIADMDKYLKACGDQPGCTVPAKK